ncbi:RsiV family protein [Lachnospiraceae bacterium 54-53]
MNPMAEAKKKYDDTPIPEELKDRIQSILGQSADKRKKSDQNDGRRGKRRLCQWGLGTAAAVLVAFTGALNGNTAFAEEMHKLPVIGAIARVLTVSSYTKNDGEEKISVEIPGIEFIARDTNGLSVQVNEEIRRLCSTYADEALERAREYKQAFLDTGGTPEEWAERGIEIKVWYEIKARNTDYLSLVVKGTESWTSAYGEEKYYNIDLRREKLLTLKDVLGKDYISKVNESIKKQMKDKSLAAGIQFWTPEEGGFESISDNTRFYMKENGNPVIVFEKYEIAPGAAGEIEFEIEK